MPEFLYLPFGILHIPVCILESLKRFRSAHTAFCADDCTPISLAGFLYMNFIWGFAQAHMTSR